MYCYIKQIVKGYGPFYCCLSLLMYVMLRLVNLKSDETKVRFDVKSLHRINLHELFRTHYFHSCFLWDPGCPFIPLVLPLHLFRRRTFGISLRDLSDALSMSARVLNGT